MKLFARSSSAPTYIIAGLGNPGTKYAKTRHNAGFMFLDYLCQKESLKLTRIRFKATTAIASFAGESVLFLAPQTFMNLSGEAIGEAASFYKIPPSNIIIVCDDKELPCGKLRIREKGSSGGQNGLKSIIAHLKTEEFPRLRIGIGKKPHPDMDTADFVLSTFGSEEQKALYVGIENAYNAMKLLIEKGIMAAQTQYN